MSQSSGRVARAMVLEEPRKLVGRELSLPGVGDDDGLLRVEACGLCGTDHEQYTGALPARFAFVPGHEVVGVLEKVGPVAAERWGVAAGDRVAVEVFLSCRACDACRAGEYRRCRSHGLGDMYGFGPAAALKAATGGLADIVVDVTGKAPTALAQGIALARPGGTIVVAGTRGSADTPGFWPDLIVFKELRIQGALGVDAPAYAAALDLLASGRFPFAELPRVRQPLEGAEELLVTMAGEGPAPPPVHGVLVPGAAA